jgi:hypothetical protein
MAEQAQGWPFLVARGRRRGYGTILAPGFLIRGGLEELLSESAAGCPDDGVEQRELDHPGIGPMTIVYETDQPAAGELGGDADDEHGRPLEILYGIVSRDRLAGRLGADDLRSARREALASYNRFLAHEDGFGVDESERRPLSGVTAQPWHRTPAAAEPARPRRAPLAFAAIAAVGLVLLLGHRALAPSGEARVTAAAASLKAPAGCRALDLEALLRTDRATTVRYRWETPAGPRASRTVRVDGRRHTRETVAPLPGMYTLVIERPAGAAPASFAFPGCPPPGR